MRKKEIIIRFKIDKRLDDKINEVREQWGFMTKSEFFRFAAIDFIKTYGFMVPNETDFKAFSKEITRLYNRRQNMSYF